MAAHNLCTRAEAATLCLADDTAAWLCGRTDTCTFVSFRVTIAAFQHPCRMLEHFLFEESLAQRYSDPLPRYTYMNYQMFENMLAIKLTVYIGELHVDGSPYFVDFVRETALVRAKAPKQYELLSLEKRVEEIITESIVE